MKITSITIRIGMTVNLGNYNSAKIEIEETAELGPEDLVGACEEHLLDTIRLKVAEEVRLLKSPRKEKADEWKM